MSGILAAVVQLNGVTLYAEKQIPNAIGDCAGETSIPRVPGHPPFWSPAAFSKGALVMMRSLTVSTWPSINGMERGCLHSLRNRQTSNIQQGGHSQAGTTSPGIRLLCRPGMESSRGTRVTSLCRGERVVKPCCSESPFQSFVER